MSGLSLVEGQHAYALKPNPSFAAPASAYSGLAQPAQHFDQYPIQAAPPIIKTKTSYTAAVVMSVLLIGGGAAGYMKLQNDTQAVLAAKDASVRQAEEARNKAVEQAAKLDQQSKTNLRQCEDKLKAATVAAIAPAATPEPSAPVVAKKPEKSARTVARSSRRSARSSRRTAQAEAAQAKSRDIPNIAKKKNLDNDPLAGLGKL